MSVLVRSLCLASVAMAFFALLCSYYFEWGSATWLLDYRLQGAIAFLLGYSGFCRSLAFNRENPNIRISMVYPVMAAASLVIGFLCVAMISFFLLAPSRIPS